MSSRTSNTPRAEKAPQTCDTCKHRHQKCTGTRPACHHCALRGIQCNYTTIQAHKNDSTAVRRKRRASDSHDSLSPIPGRTIHDIGASTSLANEYSLVHEILMTGLGDAGLPSHRQSELSRHLTDEIIRKCRLLRPPQPFMHDPSKKEDIYSTTSQHLIRVLKEIWANELGPESMANLGDTAAEKEEIMSTPINTNGGMPYSLASRRELLPPRLQAELWLQTLLNGPNKLMHVCSPAETQRLLENLYDPQQAISSTSECSITWQLAVGARFTADTDEQVYTAMYENAVMQTEICVEEDNNMLLWVVPTLLLKCVYLMHSRPRNCWLILGLAIRVSQSHCIDMPKENCPHFSEAEHSRWREVWRAILFLDCWLAMILGRVSQITALTSHDPFIKNIRAELRRPNDELEVNMTKLAVVACETVLDFHSPNKLGLDTHERQLHALEEWSASLPPSLRHFPDSSDNTRQSPPSVEDASASLYLEVFYFATILVLTSPLLHEVVDRWRGGNLMSTPMNVRFFAQTCTDSAIQIAHISAEMVRQGFICQRSWLVTTLNYHASLILTLSLSVKGSKKRWNLKSGQEATRRQVEMDGLELSMSVLSYCAQQDRYASQFLKTVNIFKDIVDTQVPPLPEQPHASISRRTKSRLGGSSIPHIPTPDSTYELAPSVSRGLTDSDRTLSTASSNLFPPYNLQSQTSTSSLSVPSPYPTQYASTQPFRPQLAQTGPQVDTYPASFDWNPSSIPGTETTMAMRDDQYLGIANPMIQHYQPFLQDFYDLEDTDLRNQYI